MKEKIPKISIIIPVYNTEAYISDCLDSLCAQTLSDIEIICVDDGSTDKSGDILKRYALKDTRISVIHCDKNHGSGYCRNLGLNKATGEYIYFLDSDDYIVKDALEILYKKVVDDNLNMLFFDAKTIYENDKLKSKISSYQDIRSGVYPEYPVTGAQLFALFIQQGEWYTYLQRILFHRLTLIEHNVKFLEDVFYEDELFIFEASFFANRSEYLPNQLFFRRVRPGSIMVESKALQRVKGYFLVYIKMREFIKSNDIQSEEAEINLAHIYELLKKGFGELTEEEKSINIYSGSSLEMVYDFYMAEEQSEIIQFKQLESIFSRVRPYEHIYIYGAGNVAKSIYLKLKAVDINAEGFIVSSSKGNPCQLFNRNVVALNNMSFPENYMVIIGTAKEKQQEISRRLIEKDICFYLYYGGKLEEPLKRNI